MIVTHRDPPDTLVLDFDMHGMRCEVDPRAIRPLWLRVTLGFTALALTFCGLAMLTAGVLAYFTTGHSESVWVMGTAVVVLVGMLAVVVIDRAQELDHYQIRLGEGWLVLRFAHQGSEIRIDLARAVSCSIRYPDLILVDEEGEEIVVPMGGHSQGEVSWLASAIDSARRDAQHGDLPAPTSLVEMLATPNA